MNIARRNTLQQDAVLQTHILVHHIAHAQRGEQPVGYAVVPQHFPELYLETSKQL